MPDCNDQDSRFAARVTALTSAWSFGTKHFDDDATIRTAANPYDPIWEPYFEERLALQMKDSLQGYERLIKLWFNQNGRCPSCGEKISRETGWHLHHRKWIVNGGDDTISNLSLMHPTCHQQLHVQTYRTNDHDCHTASAEAGV
jgi:HNH endonuclease